VKEVQSVKKYYSIDTGFFRALLPSTHMNKGVLLENALFLHLRRQETPLRQLHFLDDANSHCDFVWVEYGEITQAIQVAWDISDPKTFHREISAFEKLKCDNCLLITAEAEQEINEFGKTIRIVPAWKLLLSQP
jgi:predicted AAA+ superfamily ATPase